MEELRSLRSQPSADHHDQTKLYDGSGASDRSDPPDPADRKQRKHSGFYLRHIQNIVNQLKQKFGIGFDNTGILNESLVSLSLIESNFVMNRLGMICKCIGYSLFGLGKNLLLNNFSV